MKMLALTAQLMFVTSRVLLCGRNAYDNEICRISLPCGGYLFHLAALRLKSIFQQGTSRFVVFLFPFYPGIHHKLLEFCIGSLTVMYEVCTLFLFLLTLFQGVRNIGIH